MFQILFLLLVFGLLGFFFQKITVAGIFLFFAVVVVTALSAFDLLYGLILTTFAIALSPEIPVAGIPIRVEDLIIPIIFLLWLIKVPAEERLKPTRMYSTYGFFLAFMAIATVNAFVVNPGTDRLRATFHFLKHVEYVFLFVLGLNIVKERSDIRFLIYASLVACALVSVQANPYIPLNLTQVEQTESSSYEKAGRVGGVQTETATIFGGYLLIHLMLALGFCMEENRILYFMFYLLVIFLIMQPLLLTMSRTSYAALTVGLISFGILTRDIRVFLGLLLIPFLAYTLLADNIIHRYSTIFLALWKAELASSWQARLQAWIKYFPTIIKYPLIGRGLYYVPMGFIDNDYVLRAVQTGMLGLLSFLWVIVNLITRAWNLLNSQLNKLDRQLGLGFVLVIISLSVHGIAATSFTTIRTAEPFYLFSGVLIANYLIKLDVGPRDSLRDIELAEKEELIEKTEARNPSI